MSSAVAVLCDLDEVQAIGWKCVEATDVEQDMPAVRVAAQLSEEELSSYITLCLTQQLP